MTAPRARTRLRVLFFLLHPGYLRYFAPVVRELAERGHEIHLAFAQPAKSAGDLVLAERLAAAQLGVTFGDAPSRDRTDGWRPLATLVRTLTDIVRFGDPRFDAAPALRERPAREFVGHLAESGLDPVSRSLARRAIGLLARPRGTTRTARLLRLLAAVEDAIPTSAAVDGLLAAHRPNVVLVTPVVEFGSPQVEPLKSGLRAGIPTGIPVASWDNLTSKGHLRVVPDRVFVWNEIQRREAAELHGIPPDRVVATGSPKFDEWFSRVPKTTRNGFAQVLGLEPERPFVLYLCSSQFIAPAEVPFVRDWIGWLRASGDETLRHVGVVVRPHPQHAAQWDGVGLPSGAVVHPPAGAQPDEGAARADFFEALSHAAAVVGVNTSALIEAGIVGRTVLSVADERFAATQEGTLHFRYLLAENGGFVQHARSRDEHLAQLAAAVRGSGDDGPRTRAFVERFVRPHGLDRPAAPILADAIEELAAGGSQRRSSTTSAVLLRWLVTPVAAVASITLRHRRNAPAGTIRK